MFLINTKPNISYVFLLVYKYMSDPFALHLNFSKRILRYVKGIVEFGIHYFPSKEVEVLEFSDSSVTSIWMIKSPHIAIIFFFVLEWSLGVQGNRDQ